MRGAAVVLLASLAAVPALAQQQISMGTTVNGVLTVSSPTWSNGARYAQYTFMGQAGQQVQIGMNASAFDPFVHLMDPSGNEIGQDDDGGDGLNSLLTITLRSTGMHRIIARALRSDQFGNFVVSLRGSAAMMASGPAVAGTIGFNQQVTGTLTPMDGQWQGKPTHLWNMQCAAGQGVQIDLLSTWDNYLLLLDPVGNEAARDDDGGDEGLNARIFHTCAATGIFRIAVTTFSTSTTPGQYTLQVRATGQPMAMQPQPIGGQRQPISGQPQPIGGVTEPQSLPGATMPTAVPNTMPITGAIPAPGVVASIQFNTNVQGRLETGDQQMNDGTWADVWTFTGTAGQRVRLELRSEEFDTYIQLLDAAGNRIAEDDDSLGDLDSMVEVTLPASGTYQVVVNNIGEERRAGIYTLTLR